MSNNDHLHLAPPKKKTDARVKRTRDALGDALIALMQEKPFETITVQEVLDRAQVSRSTFYTHYSDKDDLLMSDAEEFFEALSTALSARGEKSDRVFPVREFFAHLSDVQPFFKALVKSGKFQENMELARGHFARGIERRLSELPRGKSIPPKELPAIAFAHAGALLSLITWWIDRGMRESPAEMDELFHRIVWNGASKS
ncbi:MAG TPA: TetR/AcrR family transcriptional regulator [Pyrinomonadaceae bacterium]|nr:TetR/AcrR family transcriptional regulator [Pyrinomonadaceae bacterium]